MCHRKKLSGLESGSSTEHPRRGVQSQHATARAPDPLPHERRDHVRHLRGRGQHHCSQTLLRLRQVLWSVLPAGTRGGGGGRGAGWVVDRVLSQQGGHRSHQSAVPVATEGTSDVISGTFKYILGIIKTLYDAFESMNACDVNFIDIV